MEVTDDDIKKMVSSLADRLYTYAHFLTEFCIKVTQRERYGQKDKHFFYTLLFKATNELTAVGVLFKNFYEKAALQGGMYLILRTVLSDCLAGWHVSRMRENGEDFNYMIDLIHFDHVNFSIKSLSGPYNQINRLPPQELEKQIQSIKSANPAFFHSTVDDCGKTIYRNDIFNGEFYSLKRTITYLTQQKLNDEEKGLLNHLFYYYDLFSKLEHPGMLTFMLVHKGFDPRLQERSLIDVAEALLAIEPVLYEYMLNWPELLEHSTEFHKALKNLHIEARSLIAALKMRPIEGQ
nr:hypothetical protein [Pedobacter panaciterrae]